MPLSNTTRVLGGLGAAVIAAGVAIVMANRNAAPATGDCFRDQNGNQNLVSPGLAGRSSGIPPAHGVGIWGDDGLLYGLIDQCPISGPETRYKRPQASAGPLAIAWWEFYWTSPNAYNNRCYVLPAGRQSPPVPADRPPCATTSRCRPFTVQGGTFVPRIYPCAGVPVPTPVGTAVPQPTPNPCAPCPCLTPGVTAPPQVRTPTRPARPTRVAFRGVTFVEPS